jgi:uncharacterized membrane-anchored protein
MSPNAEPEPSAFSVTVWAQQAPEPEPAAAEQSEQPDPADAVWNVARAAMLHGPQEVRLAGQGKLSLPEGFGFIPQKEGAAVLQAMGNSTDENFIGLIFPDTNAGWFATVDFDPAGYIEDGDAKDWDSDELLDSLKDGTKEGNKERRKLGITPIEVTKWVEVPAYDASQHRLVWSAEVRDIGGQEPDPTINYNTYVLGREGYISLNLITSSSQIEKDKPTARQLLTGIQFNQGKRYTDFNEATDKVADYGLAALVGGLAIKKLGLLGTIGLLLAKFGKLILIGLAAFGGILVKFFRRGGQPA